MKHRVTKQFKFEMAHRLPSHKGACRFIHGHSYLAEVTVEANSRLNENGMVLDFSELKGICAELFDSWDHALMVAESDPMLDIALNLRDGNYADVIVVCFEPTAENMSAFIFDYIDERLIEEDYSVYSIRVWETTTAYADYTRSNRCR